MHRSPGYDDDLIVQPLMRNFCGINEIAHRSDSAAIILTRHHIVSNIPVQALAIALGEMLPEEHSVADAKTSPHVLSVTKQGYSGNPLNWM
jgi:hypothetical protein